MLAALLPLRRLTAAGMSVLVNHHPRKHAGPDGQSSRGSGALLGYVDILMELHWYASPSEDSRRRRLLAWSRHEATPRQLLIELSADSRDYLVVAAAEDEELSPLREVLWRVLGKLTDETDTGGDSRGLAAPTIRSRRPRRSGDCWIAAWSVAS